MSQTKTFLNENLKAEMFSNFHEIVAIEEGKPKETTFKASKCKRALESAYKFRTDSGRKLSSVILPNSENYFHFYYSQSKLSKFF